MRATRIGASEEEPGGVLGLAERRGLVDGVDGVRLVL